MHRNRCRILNDTGPFGRFQRFFTRQTGAAPPFGDRNLATDRFQKMRDAFNQDKSGDLQ
jgi:hypothetical protein